jgi:hypothetical protein
MYIYIYIYTLINIGLHIYTGTAGGLSVVEVARGAEVRKRLLVHMY